MKINTKILSYVMAGSLLLSLGWGMFKLQARYHRTMEQQQQGRQKIFELNQQLLQAEPDETWERANHTNAPRLLQLLLEAEHED